MDEITKVNESEITKIEFKMDEVYKLGFREQAREKIDMFFGDKSNFMHPLNEAINNCDDELYNNFDTGIMRVKLHDDLQTMTVSDTGRGIPIYNGEQAELLLQTLFAGGKYEVGDPTTGTFGCGLTATNYNSVLFECTSYLNGKEYYIKYTNGGIIEQSLTCIGDTDLHGTTITFKLDKDSFDTITYDPEEVKLRIRRFSQMTDKIFFQFDFNNEIHEFNYKYDEYFDTFAEDILGNPMYGKTKNYKRMTTVEVKGDKKEVEETLDIIAIIGTTTSEFPLQETMLNGNYLKDNGTIYDGVLDGIKNHVNKYCKDNKLYKNNEKDITVNDVELAVAFTCKVFNNLPSFTNQTKFSTKKDYYKDVAKDYMKEYMEIYKNEKEKDYKRLVDQILICKRANDANIKARQKLKAKLTKKVDGINEVVKGFIDCELEKGGEFFLVEGDSANGSVVLARDSHFQASYPVRGKMLNVNKAKWEEILDNEEIMDMVRLWGCGIEPRNKYTKDLPEFDINKMKYSKIILTADADSDGKQINVLGLTIIKKLMKPLLLKGYVYISQPPIFQIDYDGGREYAFSVKQKEDIIAKFKSKKPTVHRLKGLGEMSPEVMHETVMNPETRVLQQVTIGDVEKMERIFEIWMNDDVADRKEYIAEKLHEYLIEPPVFDATYMKDICDIVVENMMEYASDVIFDRALLSIESGLKPSQLRCLWAMYVKGVTKLTKSMNVTGFITSYHPHGSAYSTIVKLCQGDRHHIPLIDYEGNLGQHTSKNLSEASDRYTNIKLSKLALDSLKEIDKHYVQMIDTYDNKNKMPLYLPSKYPLVLTQSANGIAVGMACKLPSFNMNELNDAIIKYINSGEKTILVPDFATGGKIIKNDSVLQTVNYKGKGSLTLRGEYEIDGKNIIIHQVPYGVRREEIIDQVIKNIKNGKLKECTKVKDLTDIKGMRIKLEFKNNTNMDEVVLKLFKLTKFESKFGCDMNVLHKGMPSVLGVWSIIDKWIVFRKECIINGMKYDVEKLNKDIHKLEGYKLISKDVDGAVNIIRFSKTIREDLKSTFGIDDIQSEYIENIKLTKINELEIKKETDKLEGLRQERNVLECNMNSPEYLNSTIIKDLEYINNNFKVERRTEIIENLEVPKATEVKELLVEDYNCQIQLSKESYFKKTRLTGLNASNKLKDGDEIKSTIQCTNKDEVVFLTEDLNGYKYKLYEFDECKLSNLGTYMQSQLKQNILGMVAVSDLYKYAMIVYNDGNIAKINIDSYRTLQNRQCLSKSLRDSDVFGVYMLEDDCNVNITVSDGRIKEFNTNELTVNKSRNSSGKKIQTWKKVNIVDIEIIKNN